MSETLNTESFEIEEASQLSSVPNNIQPPMQEVVNVPQHKPIEKHYMDTVQLINCLRDEKITIRHINKKYLLTDNPKHVYYGGIADNAIKRYTVPLVGRDTLQNPLTKEEQAYLEYIMQSNPGYLSVYNKPEDNFWVNFWVELGKDDTFLDLTDPMDYIRYKVLLLNDDYIAPNIESLTNSAKASYEFVIISKNEEQKSSKMTMTKATNAYRWFGKIESDRDKLVYVLTIMEGKAISDDSSIDFIASKVHDNLQKDPGLFLSIVEDKLFDYKLLIIKAVKAKLIIKNNNFYYLADTKAPMAPNPSADPTLNVAASYLASPKQQELKFALEAKLNK